VLVLTGCAVQRAQRAAERDAPSVTFQGPLRPAKLTPAQIEAVQQAIAKTFKDPASVHFGASFRAGVDADREIEVCGFVNGRRFVGLFAKPEDGATEFLPIAVGIKPEDEDVAKLYCRDDGIYQPM
jgi:hypothetical protein